MTTMFANHTAAKKRARDDSSDSEFDEERYLKKSRPEFHEHRSYRNHGFKQCLSPTTLPHRPSLTPSPPRIVTQIEVMTPAQSEYEGPNSPKSMHDESFGHSTQSNYMDDNMDTDEDDMDIRSQPPESPALSSFGNLLMRPAMLNSSLFTSDSANTSGRIPTPIYPTFKRGGTVGLNYIAGGLGEERLSAPVSSNPAPLSRKNQRQELDQDRNRRIPSPISEDEDVPDTPTAYTQSQLSRLSFSHASVDPMETEAAITHPVVPPTPRGRKRSGALTGMGRFSMGYRDDCEKCRQRVPGHYSHFLP